MSDINEGMVGYEAYRKLLDEYKDLTDELSEARETNARLRALVDQMTRERDSARMESRGGRGRRFAP